MTTDDPVAHSVAAAPPAPVSASDRPRRFVLPLLALFALLVHSPVLATPRFVDDYNQLAMIEGRYPSHPGPFDLYDFINDANRGGLIERGVLPWWSQPGLRLRFLRPLPSALLWMDRQLFGDSGAFFDHLHSLLWWSAASYGVFALLERLFSRRVAVLGVLVFMIAPCHGFPLSWLANREALVSTAIGTFALSSYSRWREGGAGRDALASFALFAAALLGGEYTLCFGGYVLAMELSRPGDGFARRISGVAPFALPALAYLAVRRGLHYGALGTGYYHDPLINLGEYLGAAPRRLAVLFTTAWVGIDDRRWMRTDAWKIAALTGATIALLAVPVRRVLRELDAETRGRAAWLLVGSVLALAPVMAVGASVRLLEIPMIGVSAWIALVLDHAWFPARPRARDGAAEGAGVVALALAFIHLVLAPADTFMAHRELQRFAVHFKEQMSWLRERAHGKSAVMVLRANLIETLFATPLMLEGETPVRDLSFQSGRCLLLRTAPNTVELVAGTEPLFPVGPEDLVRNADVPLHAGDSVDLAGVRATVVALRDDGTPRRLRYVFDRNVDDPSLLWVVEKASGFEEQKLPALGLGEPLTL
jgi:hypothetical protein